MTPAAHEDAAMLRNVLIMASSGIVLFSKEYVNGVAQVTLRHKRDETTAGLSGLVSSGGY